MEEVSKEIKEIPEKPENIQVERDKGGKFIQGVSGNPLGKPKGIKNKTTIEKKIAEDEFKNRILKNIQDLLTSQMNIAKGASYLYRIDETGEGKNKKREHTLVTDPHEIEEVLNECEGNGVMDDNFYYITTKTPDNRAIDSLIDRVFGKAIQKIETKSQIHQITIAKIELDIKKILDEPKNKEISPETVQE